MTDEVKKSYFCILADDFIFSIKAHHAQSRPVLIKYEENKFHNHVPTLIPLEQMVTVLPKQTWMASVLTAPTARMLSVHVC